jgi:hypothetical protein
MSHAFIIIYFVKHESGICFTAHLLLLNSLIYHEIVVIKSRKMTHRTAVSAVSSGGRFHVRVPV